MEVLSVWPSQCSSVTLDSVLKDQKQDFIFRTEISSLTSFHETSQRNSPLWELLPSNLSWSPFGSRESNWLANCREACKYDELERQYKCGARDNYVRIFSFMTDSCKMTSYCRICAGLIGNPPDNHSHCVACLGLAHAEAALEESDCAHCADLPLRVLRTRRNVVRGLFGVRPTADNVPLVGPPPPLEGGGRQFGVKSPFSMVASIPSYLLRWLFPSPSIRRRLCFLWPAGRGGLHVHFSLREGGMGWIGVGPLRQRRPLRHPRGAHKGHEQVGPGAGARLESSRGAGQEQTRFLVLQVQSLSSRHENVSAVFFQRPWSAR